MFKKILNQLEKELEEKRKKDKEKFNAFDMWMAIIWTFSLFYVMIYDSKTYFYMNYIWYLLIAGSFLFYLCYSFFSKRVVFSAWSDLQLLMVTIVISTWIVPNIMHSFYLDKKIICFNAKITYKLMLNTQDRGYISFDINYTDTDKLPRELIGFSSLRGLLRYEYDELPKTGSNIKICGEISKVGYSYDYIEPIKL